LLAFTLLLDNYLPNAHGTYPSSLSQRMLATAGAVFNCRDVFDTLYRPAFQQASEARVIVFEETDYVILRSGIANLVINHLVRYFEQFVNGKAAADIHGDNFARFLSSGHCIYENCVVVFGDHSDDVVAHTNSGRNHCAA
jgi:hypothetical protein